MNLVPRPLRSLALLALVLNAADAAVWPLVPSLRADLGLSGAEVGAFFAAPTLVVLISAVPVGQLGARFGPRPFFLLAAVLVPVSLATIASSPGLGVLLAGRLAFGLAFAIFWSLGPALAASRLPGTRGSAVVMTAAGAGWLVGPLLAGVLARELGWRAPLLVIAALALPVVAPFLRPDGGARVSRPVPLRETFAVVRRSRVATWAVVTSAMLGAVTGAIGVLVPTVLADNGIGSAGIGVVVAVSSCVWVTAAAWSGRIRGRVSLRIVGTVAAALAVTWVLPVVSASSAAVVSFLIVAAACRALLGALLYPLGATATNGEASTAALSGVLNLAWAAPALLTPLAAGVALEHDAPRLAFAVMCAVGAMVAAGMLATGRRVATA